MDKKLLYVLSIVASFAVIITILKCYDMCPFCKYFSQKQAHCAWIESKTIETIFEHIGKNERDVLVVLDIDNTIITPKGLIGSDQWFNFMIKNNERKGMEPKSAYQKAVNKYTTWLDHAKVRTVEAQTKKAVENLQNDPRVKVLCITARGFDKKEVTRNHLASVDISMNKNTIADEEIVLGEPGNFAHGIVFLESDRNKGSVLKTFLPHLGFTPSKIIFVDDHEKHVTRMQQAVKELNIPFVGIRYAAADHLVTNYDHVQAKKELKVLKAELSRRALV